MKQYTINSLDKWNSRFNGTSLTGYINGSYNELTDVFGEPTAETDGYKTDAEWLIELINDEGEVEHVFTIYNYKDGKNYCGADGLNVQDITDWHVGSRAGAAIYELDYLFEQQGARLSVSRN